MELVEGGVYRFSFLDDKETVIEAEFVRFERGFYVFRGLEGNRIIARPTSIIIRLYNEKGKRR